MLLGVPHLNDKVDEAETVGFLYNLD